MASRITTITFDCREPLALAEFWKAALGFTDDPDNPNSPGDPEALIVDPTGHHPALLFLPVPEGKTAKNRIHLDLMPDQPRDAEVERILALGATLIDDQRKPDGAGWAVLADPEGNELCVVRSAAERGAPAPVDTGEKDMPPVRSADERTMLTEMLDWYRDRVVDKVRDVAQHRAIARPMRSESNIAGLVNHLAVVEDGWFTVHFAGQPEPDVWAAADWDVDPDWEFKEARTVPLAEVVARYEAACARSRAITEAHQLDDLARGEREFTLRWALVHLLEETARHLGHLDILREHLDGTTGE